MWKFWDYTKEKETLKPFKREGLWFWFGFVFNCSNWVMANDTEGKKVPWWPANKL